MADFMVLAAEAATGSLAVPFDINEPFADGTLM